jgi:hypothetical protein
MTPYIPVLNPTNVGGYGGTLGSDASDPQNPGAQRHAGPEHQQNVRVLGSVFLEPASPPGSSTASTWAELQHARTYQY